MSVSPFSDVCLTANLQPDWQHTNEIVRMRTDTPSNLSASPKLRSFLCSLSELLNVCQLEVALGSWANTFGKG